MKPKPRSLMVLMPLSSSGLLHVDVANFLTGLAFSYAQLGVSYQFAPLPGLDQAQCRAELLAYYYEKREHFEDVLFLDSDMMTSVEVIHELCRIQEGIVLCPYEQRHREDDARVSADPLTYWAIDTSGQPAHIEAREGRRMVKVRGAGFGCVRMRREVVEKLYKEADCPIWRSLVPGMMGHEVHGLFDCIAHEFPDGSGVIRRRPEDMSFFSRASDVGVPVYALCDTVMWHATKTGRSLWEALTDQERKRAQLRKRVDFELADCPDNLLGLSEVLDGAYEIPGFELDPGDTILDIGANIGAFAVWASKRFPRTNILCYEPEKVNFDRLLENIAPIKTECNAWRVSATSMAVVGAEGDSRTEMLYPGPFNDGEWSLHPVPGIHNIEKGEKVRTMSASRLPPCQLLKIDTEGAEVEILKSYPYLSSCKGVMLEWHSVEDYVWIMKFMRERGFVPMVDRARGRPAPDRELCFVAKDKPTATIEAETQEDHEAVLQHSGIL